MKDSARNSPEIELLLCCMRTSLDTQTTVRIKALLQEGINWEPLMSVAQRHRVTSLLYKSLNTTAPDAVPPAVLDELRRCYHADVMNNVLLSYELVRLLTLFAEHDILAVPYKGPALAASVYGDLSLRKSGDLDILVHKYDLLKAKYLLIERGYRPVIAAADEKAWLQNHYHLHFRHENGLFLVELHWAFTYEHWGVPLDLGAMQHNLESIVLAERTIAVLPEHESLLILCIHGTKHAWSRLVWICDIAEMLRRKHAMDWTTLLAQADALRLRRILYLGLFLAGELLQAPIPQDVWRRIQKDLVVRELAAQVRNRLFVPRTAAATEFDPQKFRLQTREHWRDRFRYFRHDHLRAYRNVSSVVTPNSQDRRLFPLPNSFRFVHYGLRPLRLATLYGVRFSSLLLKYLVGR